MSLDVGKPGFFWLPETPAARVPGRLVVLADGCRVELLGSLSGNTDFGSMELRRYPVAMGELHANAPEGGTNVTLLDAFATRLSWGGGGTMLETIVASRSFVGDQHLTGKDDTFVEARVRVEGLADWVPARFADPRSVDRPRPPSVTEADLGAATIRFVAVDRLSRGVHEDRISEHTEVVVKPRLPSTDAAFSRDFVVPLRNLVSLALDAHVRIEGLELVLRDEPPWPPGVRVLVSSPPTQHDGEKAQYHPLFPFPEQAGQIERVLARWLAISAEHRRVLGLVFGLVESPPRFAEMRFDLTFEALDLVATRIARVASAAALVSTLQPLVTGLIGAPPRFAAEISAVRTRLWDDDSPPGMRLHFLTEAMTWVVKLSLALACGVPSETLQRSPALGRAAKWLRHNLDPA